MRRSFRDGFTLIELMVVVAIIGLLASIVLASLASARKKAEYTRAQHDIRTFETALELYYDTNGDWPVVGTSNYFYADSADSSWTTLGGYLKPYLPTMPVPLYPNNGTFVQQYNYYKGSVHDEMRLPIYNSVTGLFVNCVIIDDGYWMDFAFPEQNPYTLGDGGYDPDGIDFAQGNVRSTTDQSQCPGAGFTVVSV